jgi:hypothetical protein
MQIVDKLKYHQILGKYFAFGPLYTDEKSYTKPNNRKLAELPFQRNKSPTPG